MSGRGPAIALLRLLSAALPGDRLKTAAYRAFVARPRKVLRMAVTAFYRYDHVYEVLEAFRRQPGAGSVLEFGTSEGTASSSCSMRCVTWASKIGRRRN
jgi:hypothetical protein